MKGTVAERQSRSVHYRWFVVAGAVAIVLIAAGWMASPLLSRIVRAHLEQSLKEGFASDLELRSLRVTLFPRVRLDGEGLILHYKGRRDLPPLIAIRSFSGVASLPGLLRSPAHVQRLQIEGLQIQVPPRSERPHEAKKTVGSSAHDFVIDEVVADGTSLTMLPQGAGKDPLVWDIRRLNIHGAGPSAAMSFEATLTNAKPPGDIDSTGKLGPWETEQPGGTPVSGSYNFQNADLSVFRGISGKLSSKGSYHGILEQIEVEGQTDTPDFIVKISGNPVHLATHFQAVVDGTNGNTRLGLVEAKFGRSSVTARGSVEGIIGTKGKTVSLDVTAVDGRLEDVLLLGVKGASPTMTGVLGFHSKLVIPAGDVDVAQKLTLDGTFKAQSVYFSKLNIEEKLSKLSHSFRGEPGQRGTDAVASDFSGRFALDKGLMTFQDLAFRMPGLGVTLSGRYGLLDQRLEFHGTARLQAKLSQTTTGVKSVLLKVVDPFFEKKGAGAVVPIKISGTRENPSFGLDLH